MCFLTASNFEQNSGMSRLESSSEFICLPLLITISASSVRLFIEPEIPERILEPTTVVPSKVNLNAIHISPPHVLILENKSESIMLHALISIVV